MTEYVKWMPYTHGDYPPFWAKDMLASVDEDGEKVNADWAWLAWSTYYVPYEAVYGVPRPAPVEEGVDVGPVDPLVEVLAECGVDPFESWADQLREALAKRGLKIVEDV